MSNSRRKYTAERKNRLVEELETKRVRLANWLDEEIESCFTVYTLPAEHRKRMRSTNMIERLNQELLRRSRVIGKFRSFRTVIPVQFGQRLFGSMCMEQSEQWETGRNYLDMSLLKTEKQEG